MLRCPPEHRYAIGSDQWRRHHNQAATLHGGECLDRARNFAFVTHRRAEVTQVQLSSASSMKGNPLTASESKMSVIASRLGATSLRQLDKFAADRDVGIDPSASSPHGRRCIDARMPRRIVRRVRTAVSFFRLVIVKKYY
jgi:hypothetical protein